MPEHIGPRDIETGALITSDITRAQEALRAHIGPRDLEGGQVEAYQAPAREMGRLEGLKNAITALLVGAPLAILYGKEQGKRSLAEKLNEYLRNKAKGNLKSAWSSMKGIGGKVGSGGG